ncbi:hypothetical protein [Acidovorax sp.]|uniref:hypothetical protein n=1 Tax=Acidovorax sp. TaxID=1872122 RepID=UPI0027B91C91|nr:hypothetical protein [Acidovorax sp.]
MKKNILCAALAAALLSACGGSDDGDNENKLAPGDEFTTELSLDDTLTETSTYRVYGLSNSGQLVANGDDLASEGLIPIEISRINAETKAADAVTDVAAIQAFVPQLWAELSKRHATLDASKLAQEVHDLDISLATIYTDYLNSGLSLPEFVDFYETLDAHPTLDKTGKVEAELTQFLSNTQITPRQLLDVLNAHGSTWQQFLTLMASRQDDFNSLYEKYGQAATDISSFVQAYLQPQTKVLKNAKVAIEVAKLVWDVIKNNRPETVATGAFTSVYASGDSNWDNYDQAKSGASQAVTIKSKNLFTMTLTEVRFALTGYYGAKHPSIGGHWLPLVNVDVQHVYAFLSWKVNAKASVTLPVNMGTVADPNPEMPVFMQISESGLFQNDTINYEFRANGKDGFRYIGKKK